MGGPGSGRQGSSNKKTTVEDCLILDINTFAKKGCIVPGYSGPTAWGRKDAVIGHIGWSFHSSEDHRVTCRLQYVCTVPGGSRKMDYTIELAHTLPHFGGVRWWWQCPLVVDSRSCLRRVSKLYRPPGRVYFGCRHCYDLTYTSCRDSHKLDGFFRDLAAELGCSTRQAKRAFAL